MPQAPEAKNNGAWVVFCSIVVKKNASGKQKTPQTKEFTKVFGLHGHFCSCKTQLRTKPLTNSRTYCYRFPMFSVCNKRCKKNTANRKHTIQHSIYVFMIAHFKRWFTSALGHLDCSFQQNFTTKKKTRRIKIRDRTFWTCFRQNLNLNFQNQFFSAVFPSFSAVFCPLNFLIFNFFSWFTCVLFMTTSFTVFTSAAFWKDVANANMYTTKKSSETALCEQWQFCKQIQPCRTYALRF